MIRFQDGRPSSHQHGERIQRQQQRERQRDGPLLRRREGFGGEEQRQDAVHDRAGRQFNRKCGLKNGMRFTVTYV